MLLAAAMAVSGCGGSSKTGTAASVPLPTAASAAVATIHATKLPSRPSTQGVVPTTAKPETGHSEVPPAAVHTVQLPSGKPLTRTELIKKANEICQPVKAISTKLSASRKPIKYAWQEVKEIARVGPPLAAVEQSALDELGKLVPPSGLANDWKWFVGAAETLADNTAKLGENAKANIRMANHGEYTKGTSLYQKDISMRASTDGLMIEMFKAARRDGFTNCEQIA